MARYLFPHIVVYLSEIFVRLKHEIYLYRWKGIFILILTYKIYLLSVENKKHNSILNSVSLKCCCLSMRSEY